MVTHRQFLFSLSSHDIPETLTNFHFAGSQFCKSDTNINYETLGPAPPPPNTSTPSKPLSTEPSFNASIIAASANPSAQLTQKRKRVVHKQASRSIGARFATVDYVDTKTLSIHSLGANDGHFTLAHIQGDSAVSLTSSSDSVHLALTAAEMAHGQQAAPCVHARLSNGAGQPKASNASPCHSSSSSGDDSYYEKTVETYLENDGIFRDSAFYSDDNIEKAYIRQEHIYSTIDEVQHAIRAKPAPPPKLSLQKIQSIVARAAPPIPRSAKPAALRAAPPNGTAHGMAGPPKTAPPKIPDIEPDWGGAQRRASADYHNTSDVSIGNASFSDDAAGEQQSQSFSSSEFSLPPPTAPPPPPPIPPRMNKKSQWIQMKCELFEK